LSSEFIEEEEMDKRGWVNGRYFGGFTGLIALGNLAKNAPSLEEQAKVNREELAKARKEIGEQVAPLVTPYQPPPPPPPKKDCYNNWHDCKDNAALMKSGVYGEMAVDCKEATERKVPYAGIQWPWLPFSQYLSGDDYIKQGRATVTQRDLPIPNGFGALKKSTVICQVDLNKKEVISINIF
jgi:hypothetical protein